MLFLLQIRNFLQILRIYMLETNDMAFYLNWDLIRPLTIYIWGTDADTELLQIAL